MALIPPDWFKRYRCPQKTSFLTGLAMTWIPRRGPIMVDATMKHGESNQPPPEQGIAAQDKGSNPSPGNQFSTVVPKAL
jgi:hypothetical protein